MSELRQNKCKCCGAKLNPLAAVGGVITCEYCGSVFTLPKDTKDDRLLNFLDSGELALDTCHFDDALTAYKKAAELDSSEPEAYFGMALAKFKVQYLKDEVNNRLQPICHEVTDKKFSDDPDYMRAYMKATSEQRNAYENKAKEIDYIQGEFYKLKNTGLDYDCFLCVKVTGDDGKTEDSKDADYIYHLLKDRGYKPFYSEYEIRNKQGADYEAHILYALYSSECMLIVCRDENYLQTKWVKNEYTRFLKLVNDEEKESDAITIAFYENAIEKLPGKHGKIQGIDFSRRSADGQIISFVENHTPEAKKRREQAAEAKQREAEEQKKQFAEQQRAFEEQRKAMEEQQRLIAEQLEKLNNAPAQFANAGNISYEELAKSIEKERMAREEEERIAREKEDRKRKEEEALKQKEEEAEKKRRAELIARDFDISNGELIKYKGKDRKVIIPDGVTSIAKNAFEGGLSITSITIPKSITSIGVDAFRNCKNIKEVHITDLKAWCKIDFKYLSNPFDHTIGGNLYLNDKLLTEITADMLQGLTEIKRYTFRNCNKLKSVVIPNTVTSISDSAFSGCSNLESVVIPNSVTSIKDFAFSNCDNLKSVVIPNSVTFIGHGAFYCCENLTIYCRADKKPKGWDREWDLTKDLGLFNKQRAKVVWGYKG